MPDLDQANASLVGAKIFLAEDTWHVATALKSVIERAGAQVVGVAASAPDAVALLATPNRMPDIAIVDLNLQGVLAYDLIMQLRALTIPIIVISGYEDLRELEGKVKVTLTKPVRAAALLDAMRQIIGKS